MNHKYLQRLGFLVISILAGFKFVFSPLSEWRDDIISENQKIIEELTQKKNLWNAHETLTKNLDQVNKQLDRIKETFPLAGIKEVKKTQLKNQETLETLVKKTGAEVKSLSWLPITSSFLHQIPVKITIEGKPQAFYAIISKLESLPPLNVAPILH